MMESCMQGVLSNSITVIVVMPFHEVWSRSLCRTLEKMVAVEQEYPGGVEHIFSPGCVPLQRCSGCCNDEKLECFPILTHNVTMQLVKINPAQRTRQYVQLSFLEHHSCECRYANQAAVLLLRLAHETCITDLMLFITFRPRKSHNRYQ
ncbi:hypothetical protein NFI96_018049, partial [Prochilodus magdalenae]